MNAYNIPMPYFPANFNHNILPQQNVIQVNGRASIDSLKMSPNSSILLMDSKDPIVWLCTSDGLGNMTVSGYDITPHKDEEQSAMENLGDRIARIENLLAGMIGGMNHGKPDDGAAERRENEVIVWEPQKNQE